MIKKPPSAEEVVIEVMRHFGFRRNYQVAKYFDVTPQTLSGWIKSGEIPPKHLIKYTSEVMNQQTEEQKEPKLENNKTNVSWHKSKKLYKKHIRIFYGIPITTLLITIFYVFLIANPIYTSISKVLPISEDGSSSNGFSGMAAQFGINIPLSIGGTVPWDEIYPEIVKSSGLLSKIIAEKYKTKKYGEKTLKEILINENSLSKYLGEDQNNRVIIAGNAVCYINGTITI